MSTTTERGICALGWRALAAAAAVLAGSQAALGEARIVAWGSNSYGYCDVGWMPSDFVAVAGGLSQGLGLKADGSVVGWGLCNEYQCSVPVPNTGFTAIAAGRHSLGLKADGSIVAWGSNGSGACNVPAPNTGFVAITAGYDDSLGLRADGSIVAWGLNDHGQCNVPPPNTGFIAIAAGPRYNLGLKTDGSIVAWGQNDYGECNVPSPNGDFVAVAAGGCHSLGLKADGSVVAWGQNDYGQCNVPSPNSGFMAVTAGYYHSLGLKADGSIVAWGRDDLGQCNVPLPNSGFVAVEAGSYFSLALTKSPVVTSFAINNGASSTLNTTVTLDNVCSDVVSEYMASESPDFSGATWQPYSSAPSFVLSSGLGSKTVYFKVRSAAWGESAPVSDAIVLSGADAPMVAHFAINSDAASTSSRLVTLNNDCLNAPTECMASESPDFAGAAWLNYSAMALFRLSGTNGTKTVFFKVRHAGGESPTVSDAITLTGQNPGSIVAWGLNDYGQCTTPAPNGPFMEIAAGGHHSLGLKADGSIVAWGGNRSGQCNVPTPNADFTAIAAGLNNSLGLKADGSIVVWGYDSYGQYNVPWPNTGFVAVAGGVNSILGLKADGSVVAWGSNYYSDGRYAGQCKVPSPNTGFVAVAAGNACSLGLKADGSIVQWGFGGTLPSPNAGFTAVAAGYGEDFALRGDGSIVTWGGLDPLPSPNTGFAAISTGEHHHLALRPDGSIAVWGSNYYGQCSVPAPNTGFAAIAAGSYHSLALTTKTAVISFAINNGAPATAVRSVTLDNVCSSTPTEYIAGESPDFVGSVWQPYSTSPTFVLSPGTGTKTVYFKVRDAAGESWVVSDTITVMLAPFVVSFAIDNGADSTTDLTATLDNACANAPTQYMASESADFAGATWQSYSSAPSFVLSPDVGVKTIYFKVRNAAAESAPASDTITLGPPVITSFIINNGTGSTAIRTVTLNNVCSGGPTDYIASESPDFTDGVWQPYSTAPSFLLSPDYGTKTVYFKVRSSAGESDPVSVTITFNPPVTPVVSRFVINDDAAAASARAVWLRNDCLNEPVECIASESADFAGAAWRPYAFGLSFFLSSGNGTKTVYFKVRNGAGESETVSDTITLEAISAWIVAWGEVGGPPWPNGDFAAVATGEDHTLGLKADGSVVAWGHNTYGQLDVPSPNTDFMAVAVGMYHSLGLKGDGSVVAWGRNDFGQCSLPSPNTDFVALAAGFDHSLGLRADGSIVAWGRNDHGECNLPAPNTGFVAVSAGYDHSLGLKADGSVVAWGSNVQGQCIVPLPNSGFTAVAGGRLHSLGLKADGSIVAWGQNNDGQCTVPSPNTGFVAVAAGAFHSLGLRSDGAVAAWGRNYAAEICFPDGSCWIPYTGQCDAPPPNSGFVAIAAGGDGSLGLTTVAPAKSGGDHDHDGDVDLDDFRHFQSCYTGPNRVPTWSDCADMDFDDDADVDLMDFAAFQACFNGPNRPPGCQ